MLWDIIIKIKKVFIPCEENGFRPEILAGNFLVYFLIGLVALKLTSFGFLMEFSKTGLFADVTKTALIEMLNTQRENRGLGTLSENPELNEAAMLKAKHMLKEDYFSHNSPSGVTPWFWFKLAGYDYYYAGENLGIGFLDSGEIHQAWNDSPLHKENLLNPSYEEIGIAILRGMFNGENNTIVVQLFGSEQDVPKPEVNSIVEVPNTPVKENANNTVVSGATVVLSTPTENSSAIQAPKNSFKLRFYGFMVSKYDDLLQLFTFYSLVIIAILLLANIFIRINVQHGKLTFKIFGILLLLIICVYLNKEVVLQFIPHVVSVY